MGILAGLVGLVYPERCVLCGEIVPGGGDVCEGCSGENPVLGRLDYKNTGHRLIGVYAGLKYAGHAKKALVRLKTTPDKRAADFFARQMHLALGPEPLSGVDLLVPVPQSKARLRERGFNQAWLLAARLSRLCGIKQAGGGLIRKESPAQHTLDRDTRRKNAENAYGVSGESVKGLRVLLVDDVLTTGATLAVCGDCLYRAGAVAVSAVAATAVENRE